MDIVIEKMAAELGLNPLEFWRKIIQTPERTMVNLDNGNPLGSPSSLQEAVDRMDAEIDFTGKWHEPGTKTLANGKLHGIGMNCHLDRHGSTGTRRGVLINMRRDGTFLITVGSSDYHGGHHGLAMIAAEALGCTHDQIQVGSGGNPDVSMDGGSQAGSASATSNGTAAYAAAMDIRQQLFAFVGPELGVNPEDLDAKDGLIFVKTNPTQSMNFEDAWDTIPRPSLPIIGIGRSTNQILRKPLGDFPVGNAAFHRGGVAGAFEVAIDPETGEVEILDFVNVCDAGRVIDRHTAEGQVLSGMWVQAAMKGTLWDVRHDPGTGVLLSQTFLDDKIPTSMDLDDTKNVMGTNAILMETLSACGPFGVQGIGEPSATANYAAYFMAVSNALGVWIDERPITPDKILKILGKG